MDTLDINHVTLEDIPLEVLDIIGSYSPDSFLSLRTINRNYRDFTKCRMKNYKKRFFIQVTSNDGKEKYTTLHNGIKYGPYKKFFVDGTVEIEATYKDGKLTGPYKSYHPHNKGLEKESMFKDGVLNGLTIRKYNNGQTFERCSYINGKIDGLRESWYDNGIRWETQTYKDGFKNGICYVFHKNGNIKEEITFRDGKVDGLCKIYHENGKLSKKYIFSNNKFCSSYETWDMDCDLISKTTY